MARSRIVLIFYIGFLCFIKNVLSHDLNLRSLLRSNFSVKRTNKNDALYTEIYPINGIPITRVLDGRAVIWEGQTNEYSTGVTLISSDKSNVVLMYIEILTNKIYNVRYYINTGSFFLEVERAAFNAKLSQIASLPKFDEEYLAKIRAQVESEVRDKPEEQQDGARHEEVSYTDGKRPILGDGDIVDKYQQFTEFLETSERSQEDSSPRYRQEYTYDEPEPSEKRTLDIADPGKNDRIRFDYEINDGTPTLTVHVRKKKRVNMVYQDQNLIWMGDDDSRLVDLTAYSDYGEFKLVQLFYSQGDDSYHKYYGKSFNGWEEIGVRQFEQIFKEMKDNITIIGNISLDISHPDKTNFLISQETKDDMRAHTYYPNTGYHLTKVGDGDKLIWSSQNRRCVAAVVIKLRDEIRLVKIELVNKDGGTSERFFTKQEGIYIRIDELDFEYLLDNPDDELDEVLDDGFVNDPTTDDDESDESASPLPKDTSQNVFDEDSKHGDDRDKLDKKDEYQEKDKDKKEMKEDYGQRRDREYEYDDYDYNDLDTDAEIDHYLVGEGMELQVLGPSQACSIQESYRGITYKTFTPPRGKIFNVIKFGDKVAWEALDNEYTEFVRIFYPNSEPKLGFLRLQNVSDHKSKDTYFIQYEDEWAFVTDEYFLQVFDQYAAGNLSPT